MPDHTRIARFINRIRDGIIEGMFYELVDLLREYGEIEYGHLFVDGLRELAEERGIGIVHGRGKRKSELQKQIEQLEPIAAKEAEYQEHGRIFSLAPCCQTPVISRYINGALFTVFYYI